MDISYYEDLYDEKETFHKLKVKKKLIKVDDTFRKERQEKDAEHRQLERDSQINF